MHKKIELIPPKSIERESFNIIERELLEKGITLVEPEKSVIFRAIHASADLDYQNTLAFSKDAVSIARELIQAGANVVTDTNMALSGINRKRLSAFGGEAFCFMADAEVAQKAAERGMTRAYISMEKALLDVKKPLIFAIGNAPTALVSLYESYLRGIKPDFIIGVPVGFVNVEASKELFLDTEIPYIINRGRKGGSGIAAAIFNALLYGTDRP